MKKFLIIFMGIFTVLAMSTVVFAGDTYVHNIAPYTKDELVELYGDLPKMTYVGGTPKHIMSYSKGENKYYLAGVIFTQTNNGSGVYNPTFTTDITYNEDHNYYSYTIKAKFSGSNAYGNYSLWNLDLNDDNPTWVRIANYDELNNGNTCYSGSSYAIHSYFNNLKTASLSTENTDNFAVWCETDLIVNNNAGEYTAGDSFFFLAPEVETPEVETPEIQESGEILVETTLPEIAQEASLETTLLEIVGLIPIILAFLISFLGLKKALRLLFQLLRQS